MDHFDVLLSLIGILFIAIIGVYVWSFKVARDMAKELGNIYEVVNSHLQKASIHGRANDYVTEKLCDTLHTTLKEDIAEIKCDVKKLLQKNT